MAEATPSGREGLLAGMIRLGEGKRAAHRGRFALPWESPVAGRDERPRSSAVGDGACLRVWVLEDGWKRGRLTGDGSPYLGAGLLQVGMSVPAHPRGAVGRACAWDNRGWL